jgi:hypothetical protein
MAGHSCPRSFSGWAAPSATDGLDLCQYLGVDGGLEGFEYIALPGELASEIGEGETCRLRNVVKTDIAPVPLPRELKRRPDRPRAPRVIVEHAYQTPFDQRIGALADFGSVDVDRSQAPFTASGLARDEPGLRAASLLSARPQRRSTWGRKQSSQRRCEPEGDVPPARSAVLSLTDWRRKPERAPAAERRGATSSQRRACHGKAASRS